MSALSMRGEQERAAVSAQLPDEALPIAYLVPEFPAQTHIFFWRELKALADLGVEASLFSTRQPVESLKSHAWSQEAERRTTYLWPLGLWAYLRGGAKLLSKPKVIRTIFSCESKSLRDRLRLAVLALCGTKLQHCMKQQGLHHVHVHSCANAAYIAMFAHLIGDISYSLTLHNPISIFGPDQPMKWSQATFAIVITQALADEALEFLNGHAPKCLEIAPMGVDLTAFARRSKYVAWSSGPVRIFSCGRLNLVKGHADLLHAAALLRQQGVATEITIAGEDDDGGTGYRHELESLVKILSLEQSVNLLGAVDESSIVEQLEKAHLFVLPSHDEPLGVALMEAMAMELPCIGTDAGGVPELIKHLETGWLIEPQAPKAIANAVRAAIADPQLATKLGRAAATHVRNNFTSDRSALVIARHVAAGVG